VEGFVVTIFWFLISLVTTGLSALFVLWVIDGSRTRRFSFPVAGFGLVAGALTLAGSILAVVDLLFKVVKS